MRVVACAGGRGCLARGCGGCSVGGGVSDAAMSSLEVPGRAAEGRAHGSSIATPGLRRPRRGAGVWRVHGRRSGASRGDRLAGGRPCAAGWAALHGAKPAAWPFNPPSWGTRASIGAAASAREANTERMGTPPEATALQPRSGEPLALPGCRQACEIVHAWAPLVVAARQSMAATGVVHLMRRPREAGDPVTPFLSFPSCPQTRASMDVAPGVAVVTAKATARASGAPPTPSRRPRKGGDE